MFLVLNGFVIMSRTTSRSRESTKHYYERMIVMANKCFMLVLFSNGSPGSHFQIIIAFVNWLYQASSQRVELFVLHCLYLVKI